MHFKLRCPHCRESFTAIKQINVSFEEKTQYVADPKTQAQAQFENERASRAALRRLISLGFLAQWGANPLPWRLYDAIPVGALCIGIVIQFRALALLLHTDSVKKHLFQRASRVFLTGSIITGAGVFLAIAADLVAQTLL